MGFAGTEYYSPRAHKVPYPPASRLLICGEPLKYKRDTDTDRDPSTNDQRLGSSLGPNGFPLRPLKPKAFGLGTSILDGLLYPPSDKVPKIH